jgi:4-hydroxy-tetrahydrodipicolinate synthase
VTEILRNRPPGFTVLSGDDSLTLAIMAAGGEGVISVVSNATPRLMARLVDWCASGDFAEARALALRLTPWFEAAFIDSNPIPVKAALAMMGKIENVLRLPLVPLTDAHTPSVRKALSALDALAAEALHA